jgi:hypothetical protein
MTVCFRGTGSAAATAHSWIGNIVAGSAMAIGQSAGAGGNSTGMIVRSDGSPTFQMKGEQNNTQSNNKRVKGA